MEDRKLVLEQPNWSQRTQSLFRRLDASPALQAQFVRDPSVMLAETFGSTSDPGAHVQVSDANRVLYEILSDPAPIEAALDASEAPSDDRAGASHVQLLRSVLRRIDGRHAVDGAKPLELVTGFNLDAELDFRTQLATRIEAELRVQLDTRLEAELAAQPDTIVVTELRAQLETRLEAELIVQLDTRLEAELRAQLDTRLEAAAQSSALLELVVVTTLDASPVATFELDTTGSQAIIVTEAGVVVAGQVELGGIDRGGGEIGRATRSAFSRIDLQKLSGFIASRTAAVRPAADGHGAPGASA